MKKTEMSEKQIFESVKIGMSRVEAEKFLGKPIIVIDRDFYYGNPPKIETWQSPPAPASISVVYSANVVHSKKFYGGN